MLKDTKKMTFTFYEDVDNHEAVGITWTEDFAVNELWSEEACKQLVASGEMKHYSDEDVLPAQTIREIWDELWNYPTEK